jgi:hypothetical protein
VDLNDFVVLEAIRLTTKVVPYPLDRKWLALSKEIEELHGLGLLEIIGNQYQITKDGKKIILLFNSERKDCLKELNKLTTDRNLQLPLACYHIKDEVENDKQLFEYLVNLNTFIVWEEFFENVKKTVNWQEAILKRFEQKCVEGVNIEKWKEIRKENPLVQIQAIKRTLI